MNRSRKDITMMAAIGVLVLFATYNFLIRPQGTELSTLRDDRAGVEFAVSDAELALLAPVDTVAGQGAPDPAALAAAVPVDPAIATLLRQLQAIAAETGMAHGSIAPSLPDINPRGPGGSLEISITAYGSHEAGMAYVQRLRDLDRVVVIEQINFAAQPDATEQLQLTARVYTSRAPVDPASVAP